MLVTIASFAQSGALTFATGLSNAGDLVQFEVNPQLVGRLAAGDIVRTQAWMVLEEGA